MGALHTHVQSKRLKICKLGQKWGKKTEGHDVNKNILACVETVNVQRGDWLKPLLLHFSDVVVKMHNSSLCHAAVVLKEEMQTNTVYDWNAVCVWESGADGMRCRELRAAEKATVEYLCGGTCFSVLRALAVRCLHSSMSWCVFCSFPPVLPYSFCCSLVCL